MPPRKKTERLRAAQSQKPSAEADSESLDDASQYAFPDPGATEDGGLESRSPRNETRIAPLIDEPEPGSLDVPDEDPEDVTHAGPPIELEIVAGPDQGKRRRFNGVRLVVGRSHECELKLTDHSVSRRHLELIQGEKGVLLRDLGSGNGTKVNGEKVSEHLLHHGDEIVLGKTKLRFVDEVAALAQAQKEREEEEQRRMAEAQAAVASAAQAPVGGAGAPSLESKGVEEGSGVSVVGRLTPSQRKLLGILAALVLLVGAVTGGVLWRSRVVVRAAKVAEVAAKLQQARDALGAERFEEADRLLDEVERIQAGADAKVLRRAVAAEMAAHNAVNAVRVLAEQRRFEDARVELRRFEPTTPARKAEKESLTAELEKREGEYKLARVRELLGQKQLDAAKQLAAELPKEAQRSVASELAALEAEFEAAEKNELLDKAAARMAAQKRLLAAQRAELEKAFGDVARKFHGGDYARAAAECDHVVEKHAGNEQIRVRAKQLQVLIPNFGRNFEEGHRKFKAGQLSYALKPLRRARELYEQIGFPGALGMQIDEELAAASVGAGKESLAQGDLLSASAHFKEARRLNAADPRAAEGLSQVKARAETLYAEAYALKDRSPKEAASKLKLLLRVLPSDSAAYEAAQEALDDLESW